MRSCWIVAVAVSCFPVTATAGNLLHIDDATLKFQANWPLDMYGLQFADWHKIAADPVEMQVQLQPMAVHGVNTVVFGLQQLSENGQFFSPDGRHIDPQQARHFSTITMYIRDHYMGTLVSLFSSDKALWLESPEAYEQAVESVAKLLPGRHSVVFVIGDLMSREPFPSDAPYPLNDPAKVVSLARRVKQLREDALVAVPAIPFVAQIAGQMPILLAAEDADSLAGVIGDVQQGRIFPCRIPGAVVVPIDRLFIRTPDKKTEKDVDAFMRRVRDIRTNTLPPDTPRPAKPPVCDGWEILFDGKDLSQWTTLQSDWSGWSVEDGTIKCAGINGTWLRSRELYEAYELELDFKIAINGNSGVFIWSSLDARSSRFGMEMQIRGKQPQKIDSDTTGAIYDILPPKIVATGPPGEWNHAQLICTPQHVTIRVNDQVVQDFEPDKIDQLARRLRAGYIGLQDHGDPVWFRDIRVRRITPVRPDEKMGKPLDR